MIRKLFYPRIQVRFVLNLRALYKLLELFATLQLEGQRGVLRLQIKIYT
jgi:hypothetical protein